MSTEKITHFKLFFDFENEHNYLNEMNRLGWKLERVRLGCLYGFSKTAPEKYATLLYAAKKDKADADAALARRCGFEEVPHTADGMKDMLYLTGKRDEVSPVFYLDEHAVFRANQIMFRRFFVMSIICLVLTLAIIAELALLFIIPMIASGKSIEEIPLFFSLSIGFSVIALVFCFLTIYMFRRVGKVRRTLEEMLRNRRKKKEAEESAPKVFSRHSITKEYEE